MGKLILIAVAVAALVTAAVVALSHVFGWGRRAPALAELPDGRVVPAESSALERLLADAGVDAGEVRLGTGEGEHWLVLDDDGHVLELRLASAPRLARLDAVAELPRLRSLEIAGARELRDLRGLEGHPALWRLGVTDGGLRSVAGLDGCDALQSLDLRRNRLESVAELAELPRLRILDLAGNRLRDLEGLAERESLWLLVLSDNRLVDVVGLDRLPRLEDVLLDGNRIETFDGLGELPALRRLLAQDNLLLDATALDHYPTLEVVNLADNRLGRYPRMARDLAPYLVAGNPDRVDAPAAPEATPETPPEDLPPEDLPLEAPP